MAGTRHEPWATRRCAADRSRIHPTGVGVAEVRDGKIVRYRDYFDRTSMLDQIERRDLTYPTPD